MKMSFCRTAAVLFMLVALSCSKQHPLENLLIDEPRESVLDRKVHLEKELVMNVPRVFRWCDTLGLKQHWISAGDAKLFVEEEGSGIPLVLINGGPGGTHHYFHPWFSRLKNVARVIYYDQRGCGRSDFTAGSQGYSVEQAVDDVDCIRQALGIDTWVVLGYSYGGFLAQYYAVKYPRHLAGLVMLGASPGMAVEVKPSRQSEFISAEENARMGEIRKTLTAMAEQRQWTQQELLSRLIYNLNLNGDWKRQNYYRPSRTRIAQMALYEWVNDTDFNSNLNTSEGMVDLTGAFQGFPSPTLILEGKWDLNWNTDHSDLLRSNHPGSTLVVFEHAAHGIYDEEPDRFFGVVGEFLQKLGPVSPEEINRYTEFVARKKYLSGWEKPKIDSIENFIERAGWGRGSAERIACAYKKEWLEKLTTFSPYLKAGFALYHVKRYTESLALFEKMERAAVEKGDSNATATALIWQGHMLDLLGRRPLALLRYKRVVGMKNIDGAMHGQFGLSYTFSPYAKERMRTPFTRIENAEP